MASPNTTFTELVTTTLREHPSEVADNVSGMNAYYRWLKEKGQIKKIDGGYEIVRPLDYAENSTVQRYSGFDTLNVGQSNVLSAAKFDWVQTVVHVAASGEELRKNSGKNQLIDLMKAKLKNAIRTAGNTMSVDLYSSGALTNQMGGLGHIIQNAGTGTVGGIDSSAYTFWKNKFREMTGTNTWSKSTIKGDMNALWLDCVRGTDKPDLVISTNDFYAAYWESLQDLARYNDPSVNGKSNALGATLMYNGIPIIFDNNSNFSTTGEKMYFLNSEYMELIVHKEANWNQLADKVPTNQDAVLIPLVSMHQLTCRNRSLQGVLIDAS